MWNEHELSKMIGKNIPYPMLADQDGSIGKMYGIYDEDSGVETIRQIKAFQLVRSTGGKEVTPSGWKPGKTTLKPGSDLVGNVWKNWKVSEAFDKE